MIIRIGHAGHYVLCDTITGLMIRIGHEVRSSRPGMLGETYSVTGGCAPHKYGSTGRVYVKAHDGNGFDRDLFPTVLDLVWVQFSKDAYKVDCQAKGLKLNDDTLKAWLTQELSKEVKPLKSGIWIGSPF